MFMGIAIGIGGNLDMRMAMAMGKVMIIGVGMGICSKRDHFFDCVRALQFQTRGSNKRGKECREYFDYSLLLWSKRKTSFEKPKSEDTRFLIFLLFHFFKTDLLLFSPYTFSPCSLHRVALHAI